MDFICLYIAEAFPGWTIEYIEELSQYRINSILAYIGAKNKANAPSE